MILLTTKFHVPRPQASHLARQRLIEQLEAGLRQGNRLSLLVAPAGFGKTTLLTSWLASYPHRTAWLSLEANDSQLARFLYYLVNCLRPHLPALTEDIFNYEQTGQEPPVELILTALLNAAAGLNEPVLLVLEDYHQTSNPQVDQSVAFLLDHLSPQLHLVITGREDLALPLSRLRVRGQLTEIRADELRFTRPELVAFLEQSSGLQLTPPQIALLEDRTEGWIAGLQLAVLSLKGQSDTGQFLADFSGSHRYIMDYLLDEVLDRQSVEVSQFLLKTALLRRMNGELCNSLLDREDAGQTLQRLETANLFIVPLDNRRQWYRYHHLFADLLLFRLNHLYPGEVAGLHFRAGRWFAAHSHWDEALYHLCQSNRPDALTQLLGRAIEDLTRNNQPHLALPWFELIPEETLKQYPLLVLYKSWVLALSGQTELSAGCADLAGSLIGPSSSEVEQGIFHAILAYNARLLLDIGTALEHGSQAVELLAGHSPVIHTIVMMLLGQLKLLVPELAGEGMPLVREALATARKTGNYFGLFQSLSTIVFMLIAQARLGEALRLLDQYDKEAATLNPARVGTVNLYWLAALRGTIYYLTNDLAAAQAEISRVTKDEAADSFEWQSKAWAFVVQALIYQAEGKLAPALAVFRKIEAAGVTLPPTIGAAPFRVSLLLKLGELAEAVEWVTAEGLAPTDPISPYNEDYYLAYARILTAQKRYDDALRVLDKLAQLESNLKNNYRLAITRILQAVVYQKMAQPGTSRACLEKAVALAAPPQLYRAFLDEDPIVSSLLPDLRPADPRFIDALLAMYRRSSEPDKQPVSPAAGLLSEREQEILGLMSEGLSNREIGERLILATGTVKRHAANIFGKLEVNNRTGAIARAREMGIF